MGNKVKERLFAQDASLGEKATTATVWAAMRAKTKLGIGMKIKGNRKAKGKVKKRRTLLVAKRGGFLPPLLPALSAVGRVASIGYLLPIGRFWDLIGD